MELLEEFLHSGLGKIDGRSLHSYRISESQYDQLYFALRRSLDGQPRASTAAAFVLWASEKYRRDFDGGAFGWSFLTEPLESRLSQTELRDITMRGLKAFRRLPGRTEGGSTQYLRTIAAEGGIPLRLMAARGGYRAALVGLVADIGRMGLTCPQEQALGMAARRTTRLPNGYRTEEFRKSFVEFAREVLELRARAPEHLSPDAIEGWLDREHPGWRDNLSLRLDGEAARSLLSEAVAVTRRSALLAEPLRRVLRRNAEGRWTSFVETEDMAEVAPELMREIAADRSRVRLLASGDLAAAAPDLMFALEREELGAAWSCRRISGRRTARFAYPLDRPARFSAVADGRHLARVDLPGGAPIDLQSGLSLWLLSESGEKGAEALDHTGSASLTTQDLHVWILLREGVEPRLTGNLKKDRDGLVDGGILWRLSGKGRVGVADWSVAVETEAECDERDEIVAAGPVEHRVLDAQWAPVFRGIPGILHRHAGRSFRLLRERDLRFRASGQAMWRNKAPEEPVLGRFTIAAKDGDGIGARLSAQVLPKGFAIRRDEAGGTVRVAGLPTGWAMRLGDGAVATSGADGAVTLQLPATARQKGRIPFALADPDGSPPISWWLVLPRQRASFQTADGNLLSRDRELTLHDLRGWSVDPAELGRSELHIRLEGAPAGLVPAIGVEITEERPLSSFRGLFTELLSLGGPDAELRLRALSGPQQSPRLVLRHSALETTHDGQRLALRNPSEGVLTVTAVDMDDPAHVLMADPDDLHALGAGRWFLLPRLDGQPLRPPRPFVEPAPEIVVREGENSPTREMRVTHFAERYAEGVTENELKRLAGLIGALMAQEATPSALDEVLATGQVPEVAVRLLFRVGPQDLTDMLAIELHGGPRWIFLHPNCWGSALRAEAEQLRASFAERPALAAMAETLVESQIAARTREILALRPNLAGHVALGLLQSGLAGIPELGRWLGVLPTAFSKPAAALRGHAERIAQRHADQPVALPDLVATHRPEELSVFDPSLRGLIEAPLFAAEVAFGVRPTPTSRQKVQLLQAIQTDPGAFEIALPAAMAWSFQHLSA